MTASSTCCLKKMAAVDVPDDDRATLVAALLGAYLGTLQQDLVVARAYQVEIDALGPPARARRRDALSSSRPTSAIGSSGHGGRSAAAGPALDGVPGCGVCRAAARLRCPRHRRRAGPDGARAKISRSGWGPGSPGNAAVPGCMIHEIQSASMPHRCRDERSRSVIARRSRARAHDVHRAQCRNLLSCLAALLAAPAGARQLRGAR